MSPRLPTPETDRERLLRKIDMSSGEGQCWLWQAQRDIYGYGRFWLNSTGRSVLAQRAAWQLLVGPIPIGMEVLHRCDNPPCVNLDHLWLGTHADNMADMARKGRHVGSRKLSDEDVRAIRQARSDGRSVRSLAAAYKTHISTVSGIAHRKRYARVSEAPDVAA